MPSSLPLQLSFDDATHKCPRCGVLKKLSEFAICRSRTNGHQSACKACANAAQNAKNEASREETRKYQREYARKPERRAQVAAYNKTYWNENREYCNDRAADWCKRNRPKVNASIRKWNAANPDKVRDIAQRKRKNLKDASGSHTRAEWRKICAKFDNRCLCCGSPHITKDHIAPLSCGGSNNATNLQPLCRSCNSKKKDRHINYRPDRLLAPLPT